MAAQLLRSNNPAKLALPSAARKRAIRNARFGSNGAPHTETIAHVRRFTNSPYEAYVTGNRRAF
jgi:hypothetical protein